MKHSHLGGGGRLRPLSLVVLALGAVTPALGQSRPFTEALPAASGGERGRIGGAVAVGQRVAVVGVPGNSVRGPEAGAVQVFDRDPVTGAYSLLQTLVPPGLQSFDRFGAAVALSGNLLVVGAEGDDGAGPNTGAAYVFERSGPGHGFLFVERLEPPLAGVSDRFGAAVSVLAGRIAVGAPRADLASFDGGAVYVFSHDAGLGTVTLDAVVTRPGAMAGDLFGSSVAIFLDRMVVGAERIERAGVGMDNAGGVVVFQETGGAWLPTQELFGSIAGSDARFGAALAFEPPRPGVLGTLVVGAPDARRPGELVPRGAVVVYEAVDGGPWVEVLAHGLDLAGTGTQRGAALALQGGVALVGAPGASGGTGQVEVLRRSGGQWQAAEVLTIPGSVAGDLAGAGVGYANQFPVIGAPGRDQGGLQDVGWVWSSAGLWAPLGEVLCAPGTVNGTGHASQLAARGSLDVLDDDFVLEGGFVAPGSFGFAVLGRAFGLTPHPGGSDGTLCLSGVVGRYTAVPGQADTAGRLSIRVDLDDLPAPLAPAVLPGETWYFQVWHRDLNPGPTSNFTTALGVTFE